MMFKKYSKFTDVSYEVKYALLDAASIYNFADPIKYAKKIRELGGMNDRMDFVNKIDASVAKEGVRNPILVDVGMNLELLKKSGPWRAGFRPPEHVLDNIETSLICCRGGATRLYAAQKLSLSVPCLISDWSNAFPNIKAFDNIEDICSSFNDEPEEVYLTTFGVDLEWKKEHIAQWE